MQLCLPPDRRLAADGEELLDLSFRALGFDSLAMVELADRLQEALRVPVPTEAMDRIATPRAALAYVERLLAAGERG
nr:acyl carrier protein [Kitasatospora sp. SID7827]